MIIGISLLNCIISKVDLFLKILYIELVRRCSYVSISIPISLHHSKEISDQHIVSYIEFTITVKQRSIEIHLNNKSLLLLRVIRASFALFYQRIQLVNLINNCYPSTLVTVLTWFHYPDVSGFYHLASRLTLLSLFLYLFSSLTIKVNETNILWVTNSLSYMKCQRYIVE
jgi:hypothetical protein